MIVGILSRSSVFPEGVAMKRKTLGLAIAAVLGIGMVSTASATIFGNNSQKGSLLIYPRITVEGDLDTLITLTNDSAGAVRVKCFYATSDPWNGSGSTKSLKHFNDFTIDLTHNQPISWLADDGFAVNNSQKSAGQIAPAFGFYPDGAEREAGELKCWAVTDDGAAERSYNHLFVTVSVLNHKTLQAYEYTAWAFQALSPTNTVLGTPGELHLDGVEYDPCPNILLGNFTPTKAPEGPEGPAGSPNTQVTLASCNQDLRQNFTPTVTKLTWTFWNQDEQARTGTHKCADSWYQTDFSDDTTWPFGQWRNLGTNAAYFRIETTADTSICTGATTSSYVGIIRESFDKEDIDEETGLPELALVRGTNLTGRGVASGVIEYDPSTPDSFKPTK